MVKNHLIEISVDEDGYADAASAACEKAESSATEYPIVYPEPFASVGIGWGRAGEFVRKVCEDLANEMGLDWECCHQTTDVLFNLFSGSSNEYALFENRLVERLQVIARWATFK